MSLPPFHDLPIEDQIEAIGYRKYVGGGDPESWYRIGRLQYHFLVAAGLRAHHRFLDVACGSLRLGQFLIPYLDVGNYFGLEGAARLVEEGLVNELEADFQTLKKPVFFYNYDFDVEIAGGFDYAIAQSLFTHLTLSDIDRCLAKLRKAAAPSAKFYFTYHPLMDGADTNPTGPSHAHRNWRYSSDDLAAVARANGWLPTGIGDWNHPRGQHLMLVEPG